MSGYYLIGEHLGHSFSPAIHRFFGRYDYELKELSPDKLRSFLEARDFSGLNVTIPYKQAVISFLDRLDPRAAKIGAVNTVVNRGGLLWGYNTDFGGMAAALRQFVPTQSGREDDRPLCEKKVLILGTGGTSRTALAVCRDLGAAETVRVSRTGKYEAVFPGDVLRLHRNAALILNCSPAGMYPQIDSMPLDPSDFPKLEGVFDCVYNPLRTRLVLAAQSRGLPARGGLYMLVKQAALACAHFTGMPVEENLVESLYDLLRRKQENLVLIGMPGAGKSTVGRLLAQKTGRRFVDTDEIIVKMTGKPITAIFAEDGEVGFRDLEEAVVRDLARNGGMVVATGGGTVLREDNVVRLKQNGTLFFLDRPLEALEPSDARPLGDRAERIARLYAERYAIYTAAADRGVPVTGTPEQTVEAILEGLQSGYGVSF